jgi:putative addiction module CopG family antidote
MSIRLAPRVEALIQKKLESGPYRSADDVVEDALLALDEREQTRLRRLRAMVRDGFDSGDGIPFSAELMDEIEREAEEAYQRGETPNPDACP